MSHLHFKFLTGDIHWQEYGGKFISRKLNNGDWDYWLVIEVINMEEATGETDSGKYTVELKAVSPTAACEDNFAEAWRFQGISDQSFEEWSKDMTTDPEVLKVEVLESYGIGAVLWSESGNNLQKLLREAHKQADAQGDFFFGFAMDRQANAIGATGWDFIAGNPLGPLGINR